MTKVFISYRRDDSQYQADRLHAAIRRHMKNPAQDIFIDVDGIPAGVDFVEHLDGRVAQCDVFLALIGSRWLDARGADGKSRRLDDPADFVRQEIASALRLQKRVVPVLFDGAKLPSSEELPADLEKLALRNGVEIRRGSFDHDVDRLIEKLGLTAPPRKARLRNFGIVVGLAALATLAGAGAVWINGTVSTNSPVVPPAKQIAQTEVQAVQPVKQPDAPQDAKTDIQKQPAISKEPATNASAVLLVENVAADTERSSFVMQSNQASIHAGQDDVSRLSFNFDNRVTDGFKRGQCTGVDGEQPILDALPVWSKLLSERTDANGASAPTDLSSYRRLIKDASGREFTSHAPNELELRQLARTSPEASSILMRWLVRCVGMATPVLVWTLHNPGDVDVRLFRVEYDILDVGQVMDSPKTTLEPIEVAFHDLPHEKGVVSRDLLPVLVIPPRQSISVRIAYRLENSGFGYTWLIRPSFIGSGGVRASGPEFKLFAAKAGQ